jgi:hypothetical protein
LGFVFAWVGVDAQAPVGGASSSTSVTLLGKDSFDTDCC